MEYVPCSTWCVDVNTWPPPPPPVHPPPPPPTTRISAVTACGNAMLPLPRNAISYRYHWYVQESVCTLQYTALTDVEK
jgi:hypothetical protein